MKHIFSLSIFITTIFFGSCADEETQTTSIPYAAVKIDIQTQIEHDFNNPYFYKIYKDVGVSGYAGVIAISNSDASAIHAFDLCCPHEAPNKNVVTVKENSLEVECPKCKSVYYIADGTGRVVSGVSTERLKSYRIIRDGYYYRIRN